MTSEQSWSKINPPAELRAVLEAAPSVAFASSAAELVDIACGGPDSKAMTVSYTLPDGREVVEAEVARVRNGVSANYVEPYMRRRDPDCMLVADGRATDKEHYEARMGKPFDDLRQESFEWLKTQDLIGFAFVSGREGMGPDSVVIAPANAGFFALGLALLQDVLPVDKLSETFDPKVVIYVIPPFRHTHFDGKQVVVHNRRSQIHELFSYNLYPGPSAKKGVYGVLINVGEREGWVTAHCSTVRVVTPYDNEVVIMHEGASGGGKSEMLEYPHRTTDGRLRLGKNIQSGEKRYLEIPRTCDLEPVTDDMALCHSSLQDGRGKLVLVDAEAGWFVRVNHITEYGTDLNMERLTALPPEPLLFLNIDAVPDGRAMIWEHIEDAPGEPCPNPRVILPRRVVPGVVHDSVRVDVRSFGVRTPPSTRENPNYGIMGLFHILPPSLAWLWRLVAPRGHANPSIVGQEGMTSEGVGSYWPFATGRKVDQANLLLDQILETPETLFILCPNQHIGAWEVSFMPQWVAREYLARRGSAKFREGTIEPSRCPLLGYSLFTLNVEGRQIPRWFLQVNSQPEVGNDGYDAGAAILREFFHKQLQGFLHEDLSPKGRQIIEACLADCGVEDYGRMTD